MLVFIYRHGGYYLDINSYVKIIINIMTAYVRIYNVTEIQYNFYML